MQNLQISKIICSFAQDSFTVMLEIGKRLNESQVSREELVDNYEIRLTSAEDIFSVIHVLMNCFQMPSYEAALNYISEVNLDLDNSVKLVDKRTDEVYGLLLFASQQLSNGSPIRIAYPLLSAVINTLSQIQGFAFILDERLRGLGLDKKMLFYNMDYLKKHDMIWCGVDNSLKSHNYWKRMGFTKLFHDNIATFYFKLL